MSLLHSLIGLYLGLLGQYTLMTIAATLALVLAFGAATIQFRFSEMIYIGGCLAFMAAFAFPVHWLTIESVHPTSWPFAASATITFVYGIMIYQIIVHPSLLAIHRRTEIAKRWSVASDESGKRNFSFARRTPNLDLAETNRQKTVSSFMGDARDLAANATAQEQPPRP